MLSKGSTRSIQIVNFNQNKHEILTENTIAIIYQRVTSFTFDFLALKIAKN